MKTHPRHDLPDPGNDDVVARRAGDRPPSTDALSRAAVTFLLIAGGVAATSLVLVPRRTVGATRTAHLEWQHRRDEIARTLIPPGTNPLPGIAAPPGGAATAPGR